MRNYFFRTTLYLVVFSFLFSLPLSVLAQESGSGGTGSSDPALQPAPAVEPIQQIQPVPTQPGGQGGEIMPGIPGAPAMPTCNINGVETPGACSNSGGGFGQNLMGPGGSGEGPGGPGGQGDFKMGPSEEEQATMDAKRQEMEKKQKQSQLKRMKQDYKRFNSELKKLDAKIKKLKAQDVFLPADLEEKRSTLAANVKIILDASEYGDEVEQAADALQDDGNAMPEIWDKIQQLTQFLAMKKQAGKEIAKLEKACVKSEAKIKRAKMAGFEALVERCKTGAEELKSKLVQAAEDEDPADSVKEIFDFLEEKWQNVEIIDRLSNLDKGLKQMTAGLKRVKNMVARKAKSGKDMSEANAIIAELEVNKARLSDLGKLDPDEIIAATEDMDQFDGLWNQLEDILGIDDSFAPPQPPSSKEKMPQMPKTNMKGEALKQKIDAAWAAEEKKLVAQSEARKTKKLDELAAVLKKVSSMTSDLIKSGVTVPATLQDGVSKTLSALGYSPKLATNE